MKPSTRRASTSTASWPSQDAGNNAAVTLSFGTRTGIKNGDVSSISPAKLYSTFSTDETGTGAIAYSEGPAARIVFFIITG